MNRLVLAVALVLAGMGTAHAEETLVVLVVNGKEVSAEPRPLDPEALAFSSLEWITFGAILPKDKQGKERITAEELNVGVEFDSSQQAVLLTLPPSMLPRQTLGRHRTIPKEVSPAPRGVLLDYDVAVASIVFPAPECLEGQEHAHEDVQNVGFAMQL